MAMKGKWATHKRDGVQLDWKEAVWQYLLDHSEPTGTRKKWRVMVYLTDRKDFEWRVNARMRGIYRTDEEGVAQECEQFTKDFRTWKFDQKKAGARHKVITLIDKSGGALDKVMLSLYRKSRNYLDKKAEHEAIVQNVSLNHQQPLRPRRQEEVLNQSSQGEQGGSGMVSA